MLAGLSTWAENPDEGDGKVCKIGDVEYATLEKAVAAVPTDGTETTITMIGDDSYTGTNPIEIASGKTIILDLNGKTISYVSDNNASDAFITNKGKLTIKDETNNGKITAQQKTDWNNGSYTINNFSGNLVIDGGTIENTSGTGLAWPLNNGVYGSTADMVINGGTIHSTNYVPVREYLMFGGTKTITINGGTFVSDNSRAIAVQFTDASVAETGSYVKVNGGTFNCKGSGIFYFDLHANNVNTTGFTFEVTAGSFTNANTESPVVAVDNEGRDQSSAVLPQKFISGGTFSKAPDAKYVAEGYEVVEQDNAFIVQKKQVAKIGETTYSSLEEAIAAVKDGETVTMLKDVDNADGVIVPSGKNFTLDFGGHTYNVTGNLAGSTGTKNQCFQLLKDSELIFKNGRISTDCAKLGVNSYANLKLVDMTIDMSQTSATGQVACLETCNGSISLQGNTSLKTKNDQIAVLALYWPNAYGDINVELNTTGEVKGLMAYGSYQVQDLSTVAQHSHVAIKNGKYDVTFNMDDLDNYDFRIYGGVFKTSPDTKYLAPNHEVVTNTDSETSASYPHKVQQKPYVAMIGENGYFSLADALVAVKNNETIVMHQNDVLTKGLTITLENNEAFTLDLNGKTVSIAETGFDFTANGTNNALRNGVPVRFAIVVNGVGSMTICDNSTGESGRLETKNNSYGTTKTILVDGNAVVNVNSGTIAADYAAFYVVGFTGTTAVPANAPKPTLNVNGGKILGQMIGIGIKGNTATLKVTGGEIIANEYTGVSTNGTQDWYDGGKFAIEITGGLIKSGEGAAMYLPAEGPTVITGGTIEGADGIVVKGGSLSISGNTIVKATGSFGQAASASSGYTDTGSAIYVEDTYENHAPIVNISGGMFSSINNKAVEYYTTKADDAKDKGKLTVYAGLYDDDSAKGYLADGKTVIDNTDETTVSNYPYAVVPLANEVQVAPDLEITSVDEESPLTQNQQTAAEKTVKDAITNMAENTEVANLSDDTKTSNNKAVATGVVETNQSVGINVEFTGTKVSVETGTTTVTLKELTFDVTPYVVETKNEQPVAVKKIENNQITAPMTFRLPIPSSVADNCARVIHHKENGEDEDMGLYSITINNDKKYIEISTPSFSQFDIVLKNVSVPTNLSYYAGNSTEKKITDPNAFLNTKATEPNAIAFVGSEHASWASEQTNVVVDYSVGTNGHYYECPKFVLTDLEDFYTPVDFHVVNGSYTRENTGNTGIKSMCLPFDLKATDIKANGADFGVYHGTDMGAESTYGNVYFNKADEVQAGTPCIVEGTGVSTWNITLDGKTIKASIDNTGAMKGTYVKNLFTESEITQKYKVSCNGDKFTSVTTSSHAWPFRAYLDLHYDESYTPTSEIKELNIVWDDEATGIESIKSVDSNDGVVYDLTGRRVAAPVKGHLYIINGRKQLMK